MLAFTANGITLGDHSLASPGRSRSAQLLDHKPETRPEEACDRPVEAHASVEDEERMASAGGGRRSGGGPGGSGLVQERTVVGVEDSPAEESQDVVPDRRWQVSGVVAAVGLGADPARAPVPPERRDRT